MKICALTMVYRDHWALAQWYRHYAAALGAENLYVIAHGPDPEIARICPGASVVTIPREELKPFDRVRSRFLNQFQRWLSHFYDWIIRTDADELVCLDPARFDGFAALFSAQADAPALFSLGFNLAEMADDPPLPRDGSVFASRRIADLSGNYSKAWAVRGATALHLHGVKVAARELRRFPFVMPRGVYLAHLKYANLPALAEADAVRAGVAGAARSGPKAVRGWQNATDETTGYLETLARKPVRPWVEAEAHAYETLSTRPRRLEKFSVLKARAFRFEFATELPDWFSRL